MLPPEDARSSRPWPLGATIIVGAAFLAAVLQASPATAGVDSVSGSATGVSVTGDLGAIPPTPTVSLAATDTSPPSALGPFTATAASVTLPSSLPFNVFSTGALSVTTSAGNLASPDDTGFVEAQALVQNVVLGPDLATATSIAGSCTADAKGATGTTTIQGGMLNGQPFPPTPSPAPNTVVPVPGLGTVTLNEQLVAVTHQDGPDATWSTRITVTAVHARFEGGAGGILPGNQTAEAIIGQVICEAAAGSTPSTTTTLQPVPTTVPPVTTPPPVVPEPALATTGSDNALSMGLLALGLGGLLRWADRRRRPPLN